MKKSYKKLLIFETIILIILLLNSFLLDILSGYYMVLFLLAILATFKLVFGFEKDRHRYMKDIMLEVFTTLLGFFLLYYLFGLITGFVRTNNYYTIKNFFTFIVPIILTVIMKELLRYNILTKSEGNRILLILTTIMFILIDVTNSFIHSSFTSNYGTFIFIALYLLPSISTNIVCNYIITRVGYRPVIFYLLVVRLYTYLLPIIPDPNEYISSMIDFLLPVIVGYRVYLFFSKDTDEEVEREYRKRRPLSLVIPTLIVCILVYFTSGYFKYHAIAIATGSMVPTISIGDVVIVEKNNINFEKISEGQVIAYKYNDVIIVHRVVRKIENGGHYYFYTKGDANSAEDGYVIEENMIYGTVNHKVPYIGLPTVWFNNL